MKISNKKKGKRGSIAIMEVIHIFIVVMVFAMLSDLIVIGWQYIGVTRASNEISRMVGIQSGVERSTPSNYPGGAAAYHTSSELTSYFSDKVDDLGLEAGWLQINGRTLTGSISIEGDYRQDIDITTTCEYKWNLLGRFIPALKNGRTIVVNKTVFGEYKRD